MLKNILLGLVGLVVVIIALGFVLPDRQHVERSVVINAPAEKIYAYVSDLNRSSDWQVWGDMDPAMKVSVAGSGVGQVQTWESKTMGSGSQTITGLTPPSRVDYKVEFGEMGSASAAMRLEPQGEATKVTWSFDANMRKGVPIYMQPMATYMGFFMDQMTGKDYEGGLAKLKKSAEAA